MAPIVFAYPKKYDILNPPPLSSMHALIQEIDAKDPSMIGPDFAVVCEGLRIIKAGQCLTMFRTLATCGNDISKAVKNCNWTDPVILGKTIQDVYNTKSVFVQIIILSNVGIPLYFDRSLKLYNARLFFVYDKKCFTGVIKLNTYFKVRYFCPKCVRKYGNKKRDWCKRYPGLELLGLTL